ncbi:hypothetical protein [Streptomyces sennicomposti]
MSAREKLLERLWWAVPSADDAEAKRVAAEMLDDALREHAHALAEKIRVELAEKVSERLAGGIWQIRTVSTAQQAADLIDPEVTS